MKDRPFNLSSKASFILQFVLYGIMLVLISTVLGSCEDRCEVEQSYTYYEPVYTSLETLRTSVEINSPQPISTHGKIFFKGNYLFINEPNKGIHVIDNSDPKSPKNTSFIRVPGSFDLVVNENYLYTDSYIDLVIIDISDIESANEVGRINDVFGGYNSYGFYVDSQLGLVTDWKQAEQIFVGETDCGSGNVNPWGLYYEGGIALAQTASFDANIAVSPGNPGMAGSMSRFALAKNHLYALDQSHLLPFDLQSPVNPSAGERQYIDWGIETLFPSGETLFIGAQNGMHIMDLTNPISPQLISTYTHVNSCDPVIVDGEHAFVTLRSGNECAGFTNQLEVINVANLASPQVEHVYQMTNPHGLGKDGDALFICDGQDGLKIYDASDLAKIDDNLVAHYKNIQAFDIIPFNNIAMMIGEGGLYQYDYSDLSDVKLLSHIQIGDE